MSSFEQKQGSSVANKQPVNTATSSSTNQTTIGDKTYRLPADKTLLDAVKMSIVKDKPIMLDYWTDSLDKKVLIGIKESNEKLLVKSAEEYTSPIEKVYNSCDKDYIILTENSIYIVSKDIPNRKIS